MSDPKDMLRDDAEDLEVNDEAAEEVVGGDGDLPTESISFNFTKPTFTYKP